MIMVHVYVVLGGGEHNMQEEQSARMSDATQHKAASTTTNTTNSPPDNSRASPVDAMDNRFTETSMNKTPPTEEGNLYKTQSIVL